MNFSKNVKRTALSVALGMCVAGGVQAQSTTGGIYGSAPAGSTITISNNSGLSRTVTVGADGRYNLGNLPIGSYTVDAGGAGKQNVTVTVGGAIDVSFGGDATTLTTVTVTGASVPKVDVTTTSTSTVITAEQLRRLPLSRSAEAIALLSPGAVSGNSYYFGSQVAFGGSSVAENAYYINGFFSGNPMTNVGGFTLPYGSIEQQETYTGGYGAKYGRSDGGVISQIGKSGSNDVHFGGQIVWEPKGLSEHRPNRYMPNLDFSAANSNPNLPLDDDGKPYQWAYSDPSEVGKQYDKGKNNESWSNTYSGYISGPIVKDHLFAFVSAETTKTNGRTSPIAPDFTSAQTGNKSKQDDPKIYAKLNWQINDNNLLEYTYLSEKYKSDGSSYDYDYDSSSYGSYVQPTTGVQQNQEFSIAKYTSYITDNLTFSATYGRSREKYNTDPYSTGLPYISGATSEDPSITGGNPIANNQATYRATQNTKDYTRGLRAELDWVLGSHTLSLGIDNSKLEGENEGTSQIADYWGYGKSTSGTTNVSSSLGVGPAGGNGYWVRALQYFDTTSMSLDQKAYYLEDKWQLTDNFLLSIGIRSDKFSNYDETGVKYVDSGNQWEPRIGASWDVFGDSSFKLFANAGRYFLAMPNAVAIRGVGASTFAYQYYTYTGIDANGAPTGLTPIKNTAGTADAGWVSSNGELGQPKDPLAYVPSDIKSEYQDEYVLGFEKTLGSSWKYGAKATYRDLKSAIDDFCDPATLAEQAGVSLLLNPNGTNVKDVNNNNVGAKDGKYYGVAGCYMFNPGGSNTYSFAELTQNANGSYSPAADGARYNTKISSNDLGFPGLKRTYKAIDLFLEHPFDGKWEARIDYTYSKSQGNSEGPANSDTGQGSSAHDNGVGTSQNWDAWQIMEDADGYLPNDRKHQIKAHASYAFNEQWLVSANLRIQSGAPIDCFGYYNPTGATDPNSDDIDPIGYYDSYHTCFGQAAPPGKTRTPWTHRYDLAVQYAPAYFDHKLRLGINVFNAFNERVATSYYTYSEDDGPFSVNNDYLLPLTYTTPRYVQFTASFDY